MNYRLRQDGFNSSSEPSVSFSMEYYDDKSPEKVLYWRGFGINIKGLVTQVKVTEAAKIEATKINQSLVEDGTLDAIALGNSLTYPAVVYDSGQVTVPQ